MKKILILPTAIVLGAFALPIFAACSHNTQEFVTGAACSIADLKKMESSESLRDKIIFEDNRVERNLRPVGKSPEIHSQGSDECFLGMCLRKRILGY